MIALAYFLKGFAKVLELVLTVYWWILLARAVVSWVSADPRNPIVSFLHSVTDPLMRVVRRRLPSNLRYFPLDIAFLVVLALVVFGLWGVVPALLTYADVLLRQSVG